MAKFTISTTPADPVRHYLEGVAKSLVDRLYGADGPTDGTKLSDIEDTILAIRQVLSEAMLDETLQRQANTNTDTAAWQCCPQCGQPVEEKPPKDGEASRVLQTRVGQAQWAEPQTYCRPCRRSFFPSDQESGD